MSMRTEQILARPFLLVQIGDYGGELYDDWPLPKALVPLAERREQGGKRAYPKSSRLSAPAFRVPTDLRGILMLKMDELAVNGFAYWAQTLATRILPRACVNSDPSEIFEFARGVSAVSVVFVATTSVISRPRPTGTRTTTATPKGSMPGSMFERWTPSGYRRDSPTAHINTDIVYTETGKTTLVLSELDELEEPLPMDLREYHVHFADKRRRDTDDGTRHPYRSSLLGTCSLLMKGAPALDSEVPPLRAASASRLVVALGRLHPHLCGRVHN